MAVSSEKKENNRSNTGVNVELKRNYNYNYSGITILFLLVLLFSIFLFYNYNLSLESSFISLYNTITRTGTIDTNTDTANDTYKLLKSNTSSSSSPSPPPSSSFPSPSVTTIPPPIQPPLLQNHGNAESNTITHPQATPSTSPTTNTSPTNEQSDSPRPPPSNVDDNNNSVDVEIERELRKCDLYMGTWVRDESYPVYEPGSCPYVDEAFDCQPNGRPDSLYLNWRWKPHGCNLPRFNATDFLVRLRGKRLMLVGDSMNRNQFESFLCLLHQALPDKSRMFEVHGYKITKGRGYYVFKFLDYNCTIEFVRSHFLVREGVRVNARGNSNPTLSIDRIDKSAPRWKKADILVFNTGHWWTHGKTARGKNYYKEGDYIYPTFDAVEAYRRALKTWGNWIDKNISPAKQLVFYRGYSSAHFRGGDWDSGGTCKGEKDPVLSGAIINDYPLKMKIVEEVISEMQVPVVLLNVTRLTNFRKDGHPSVYGKNTTDRRRTRQDCSHWCLPGVPDAWNELIYIHLLHRK